LLAGYLIAILQELSTYPLMSVSAQHYYLCFGWEQFQGLFGDVQQLAEPNLVVVVVAVGVAVVVVVVGSSGRMVGVIRFFSARS